MHRLLPLVHRVLCLAALVAASPVLAQADEAVVGAWYMAFSTATFGDGPFGAHAEVQLRNHDLGGDLQQLLLRTSGRYTLSDDSATLALGYGFIRSEAEGEPDLPVDEHRIYQEVLLRQRVAVVRVSHRFRYEQRFVEDQDTQTRYRYALFATVPLTGGLKRGDVYLAGYSEVFLRGAGRDGRPVFDRNRVYGALGYTLADGLGLQVGYMDQVFADDTDGQIQVSLHHRVAL